jgi:FkbM family methyltransferase
MSTLTARLAARLHHGSLAPGASPLVRSTAKAAWLTLAAASSASTRRAALSAVARFWYWQIGRRARGGALDVQLRPQSIGFRIPAWSQIGGMIVAGGSHELAETALLARTVRSGDSFYDVGANIGLYTVIAAHNGARVVAFEPDARARRALEDNVALAGLKPHQIEISPTALADYDGEASFTLGLDVGNHLRSDDEDGDRVTVPVCRLDTLAATDWGTDASGSLSFLKIDVEGHDLEVLRGAAGFLADHHAVVMVEVWAGGGEVREFLRHFGYHVYFYQERHRTLLEYPLQWSGQANFLAVLPEQLPGVNSRLAGGPRAWALAPPRILGWVKR